MNVIVIATYGYETCIFFFIVRAIMNITRRTKRNHAAPIGAAAGGELVFNPVAYFHQSSEVQVQIVAVRRGTHYKIRVHRTPHTLCTYNLHICVYK